MAKIEESCVYFPLLWEPIGKPSDLEHVRVIRCSAFLESPLCEPAPEMQSQRLTGSLIFLNSCSSGGKGGALLDSLHAGD